MSTMKHKVSRRDFIKISATTTLAAFMAACTQGTPVPTATATSQPPTATTGPTATPKPVVPTSTPVPVAKYHQSPILDALVTSGKLDIVDKRLPTNPRVYPSIEGTPAYGGTIRCLATSTDYTGDAYLMEIFNSGFLYKDENGAYSPELAESVDFAADGLSVDIKLREGTKWSDGTPFTADDVLFNYVVLLQQDKELTPSIGTATDAWAGCTWTKVSDYEVKLTMTKAKTGLQDTFVQGAWDADWLQKAYTTPFCKVTAPGGADSVNALIKADGYTDYVTWFREKIWTSYSPKRKLPQPVVGPWVMDQSSATAWSYSRNPYFYVVDDKGNQLPYIDKILCSVVSDVDAGVVEELAGDVDFSWNVSPTLDKVPLFLAPDIKKKVTLHYWSQGGPNNVVYTVNFTSVDPVLRSLFREIRFRQALSLALDRTDINNTLYGTIGTVRNAIPLEGTSAAWKPEWETLNTQYDPTQANALLDDLGLKVGSDGVRLRSDGKPLSLTLISTDSKPHELPIEMWLKVGIKVQVKSFERFTYNERVQANDWDLLGDGLNAGSSDQQVHDNQLYLCWEPMTTYAPLWANWYKLQQDPNAFANVKPETKALWKGSPEEPPAEIKQLLTEWLAWSNDTADQQAQAAIDIISYDVTNLMLIGTVGKTPYPAVFSAKMRDVRDGSKGISPFAMWASYGWYYGT